KPSVTDAPVSRSGSPAPVKIGEELVNPPIAAKLRPCAFQSAKSGSDAPSCLMSAEGFAPQIQTSRSGCGEGSGRSSTELITQKLAAFAPMPSASVITAIEVKPGFFNNIRAP